MLLIYHTVIARQAMEKPFKRLVGTLANSSKLRDRLDFEFGAYTALCSLNIILEVQHEGILLTVRNTITLDVLCHTKPHLQCRCEVKDMHSLQCFV